jgi:hypothetical protein
MSYNTRVHLGARRQATLKSFGSAAISLLHEPTYSPARDHIVAHAWLMLLGLLM